MAELSAVFLNCTLKPSPAVSNTEALARKVIEWFDQSDVESEIVRIVDYNVKPGVTSDEGDGDEWPLILQKIKQADIIVIATPIWFGVRASIAQLVIERLDGTYGERNEQGQYPLYNKVAGVVITGNEDGAHSAAETTLPDPSRVCGSPQSRYLLGGRRRARSLVSRGRSGSRIHETDNAVDGPEPGSPRQGAQGEPIHRADSPTRSRAGARGRRCGHTGRPTRWLTFGRAPVKGNTDVGTA